MDLKKIKITLERLGFTEIETKVYLAMLNLGSDSVQNIAKKSRISRTSAYDVIASLQDKGVVSTFQKGKKKMFTAEDPGKLETYFKAKFESMKDDLGMLKRLVPEMRIIQGKDRPIVRFFSGTEAIRAVFNDLEETGAKELLEVANVDTVYDNIDLEMLKRFRSEPFFQKIHGRSLYVGEKPRNPKKGSQIAKLPDDLGTFEGNVWIYKNRVAFTKFGAGAESIIIESQVFVDTMMVLFNASWKVSEKHKDK